MMLLDCPGGLLSAVLLGLQPSGLRVACGIGGCLAGVCLGAVVWRHAGQAGEGPFYATWMLMLESRWREKCRCSNYSCRNISSPAI